MPLQRRWRLWPANSSWTKRKLVQPQPSTIAVCTWSNSATTSATDGSQRKAPAICRYPVFERKGFENERCHEEHLFCGEPIASGSASYCLAHHELTRAAPKSGHVLKQETIARKLSRLAIVAALKRE